MAKSPAFQFYPADYLSDERVMLLPLEAEGAYIRLISHCWLEGSIPSDSSAIAQLCKNCSSAIIDKVAQLFEPHPNLPGRLVHKRLERERVKQAEFSKERKESGLRGANKRWKRNSSAMQQPLAKNSSSSSSSSSSSDIHPLPPQGVDARDFASEIYVAYPRKIGKQAAFKKIKLAIKAKGGEYILERTKMFADAVELWPDSQRQYIPHPATWFHQGRYDDDPNEWIRVAAEKGNGPPKNKEPETLLEKLVRQI